MRNAIKIEFSQELVKQLVANYIKRPVLEEASLTNVFINGNAKDSIEFHFEHPSFPSVLEVEEPKDFLPWWLGEIPIPQGQ